MEGRKRREREVEKLISKAEKIRVLDEVSALHAKGARRMLHLMSRQKLDGFRAALRAAIDEGRPLKIRKT